MGLFSFIKNAGEKVLINPDDDIQEVEKCQLIATELTKHVQKFNIPNHSLQITVQNSTKVILKGNILDQDDVEKIILIIGNVIGISEVDNQIKVENIKSQSIFHTVCKTEKISKIAKKYYNDATKYEVIFHANKPMLKNPDLIYSGQVLRIPNLE